MRFFRSSALPSDFVQAFAVRRPRLGRSLAGRLLAAMALFAACGLTPAMAGAIAVVVDPGLEVNELSFAELRKIMIGERQFWAAGQQIKLIVRAPVAAERNVLLRVYEMSEAQFRKYWIAKIFRAEATIEPLVTQSNEEAVGLVGVLRGAITFVDAVDVPDGLKVIRIDGRMPGEPGYRFN